MKIVPILILNLLLFAKVQGQPFSRQDSLRGSITPEREWWDLVYYHLDISVNPADSTIEGSNKVVFRVLQSEKIMQIDLQLPMAIRKVMHYGESLDFIRDGNVYYIEFGPKPVVGSIDSIRVYYGGKPQVAKNPPWDGGLIWSKDPRGKPLVATACQQLGASVWWPCKDHMYDEPDSMLISVKVPSGLMDVSNGRLREIERHDDGSRTFHWFVSNPISNYVVNVNIADYAHFSEVYHGEKGPLDCDYYVLKGNLKKAKKHFRQVPMMLEAFEYWFGPYPFYEDGYKLVEVPYLGMEHQSSITYGNGYQNGYDGFDLSHTGWGMKFDFMIVHESGHEWFANSITYKDIADMWIHESFTNYSESLFLEYHYGREAGREYVLGTRMNIENRETIIGYYDVNRPGSQDMYYKGGNMLHTLRQIVADDSLWHGMFRAINREFYHRTVGTEQIESFMADYLDLELDHFFDQYLRDIRVPVLEYRISGNLLLYRWNNCIPGFKMPVRVMLNEKEQWLYPTTTWKRHLTPFDIEKFNLDRNFYAATLKIM